MADNVYMLALVHVLIVRVLTRRRKFRTVAASFDWQTRASPITLLPTRLVRFFHRNSYIIERCTIVISRRHTAKIYPSPVNFIGCSTRNWRESPASSFAHVIRMQTIRENPVRGKQADRSAPDLPINFYSRHCLPDVVTPGIFSLYLSPFFRSIFSRHSGDDVSHVSKRNIFFYYHPLANCQLRTTLVCFSFFFWNSRQRVSKSIVPTQSQIKKIRVFLWRKLLKSVKEILQILYIRRPQVRNTVRRNSDFFFLFLFPPATPKLTDLYFPRVVFDLLRRTIIQLNDHLRGNIVSRRETRCSQVTRETVRFFLTGRVGGSPVASKLPMFANTMIAGGLWLMLPTARACLIYRGRTLRRAKSSTAPLGSEPIPTLPHVPLQRCAFASATTRALTSSPCSSSSQETIHVRSLKSLTVRLYIRVLSFSKRVSQYLFTLDASSATRSVSLALLAIW